MKDQKDIDGLISALKDDNATIRYRAAQTLDELRDLRAVGPLSNALHDEAMTVRARAAEALGRLGDGRTVEPLVWALDDASANVRYAAAAALERSAFGRESNRLFGCCVTMQITSFARKPHGPSERWGIAERSSRLSMHWQTRTTT